MASRKIEDLLPVVQVKIKSWLSACKERGIDVLVYCTYRDGKEQDALYAIGRTVKGKIVTNAKAGQSYHQYKVAWDCVPMMGNKPLWSGAESTRQYKVMAEEANKFGIEWSGNWKGSLKETAHFQYTGGLKLSDLQNGKEVK